ncbi:DC-STAMP domain-containing protein 1 [Papilio machaon]|uniref:DC-STAMP domain-containing protein 1 n=1 Tax=Papilio machaon TaxID=76193 RepID=A0A194QVK6_PAPMA|nr:DC-STAMP domain-containing protein 1 [Papilio machaon]
MRCISLLMLPMYCGKAGRGVLKAVVLTYVIAGPITNMGYNAKEVVRVFACSAQLSYNLSLLRYNLMAGPIKKAILASRSQINVFKDTFRSIDEIITPIENEIEGTEELVQIMRRNIIEDLVDKKYLTREIEENYNKDTNESFLLQDKYLNKLSYRCKELISRGIKKCEKMFVTAFDDCYSAARGHFDHSVCWPLNTQTACDLRRFLNGSQLCDAIDQDAKETGKRVMHEFEERGGSMQCVLSVVNVCLALILLRIVLAAQAHHDRYLTNITYDNIYITSYFKRIDKRRKLKNKCSLLPLKKMERNKYVDVHSLEYKSSQRSQIVTPIHKVLLEVVTATTFVMLDRLFYEALDVVRQHAEVGVAQQGTRDLEIEVEGQGTVATMMRNILSRLNETRHVHVSNELCLPHPRAMPTTYFIKIYCEYLWILLLLYLNPYTLRLNRLICSYFYPKREKQRILHLYNDILKKRMKMQKTLRRKALQAVRAQYLSGENLRSLRMRFPQLLGWLSVFPAARMTCLICGETEPKCNSSCGFAWCDECWRAGGGRCLACDPLTRLSDLDSLSEDQLEY